MTPEERMNTFLLYPEWFGGDRIPERFVVSAELRQRLREWNQVWETVLDPVTDAHGSLRASSSWQICRQSSDRACPSSAILSGMPPPRRS